MRFFAEYTSIVPPNTSRRCAALVVSTSYDQTKCRHFLLYTIILLYLDCLLVLLIPGLVEAQNLVRVKSETRLELSVNDRSRSKKLTGTLRDSLGIPLRNQRIKIVATTDRESNTVVITDSKGVFTAPIIEKSPDFGVRARFKGNALYEPTEASLYAGAFESSARPRSTRPSSRQNEIAYRESVNERRGEVSRRLSVFWLLVPMFLTLIVVVAIKRRRTEPISKFEYENETSPSPGIRRSLPDRYGRKDRATISGTIRDLYSGDAVPHVELTLTHEQNAFISLDITSEGFFSSPSLAPGKWRIQARADGYTETTNEFLIPHRGEWTNVRIQMMSMRSLALQSYRKVALALLPTPQVWDIWTARETLQNTSRFLGSRSVFRSLVSLVERSSYRRNPPSWKEVKTIETQASSVLREISQRETTTQ